MPLYQKGKKQGKIIIMIATVILLPLHNTNIYYTQPYAYLSALQCCIEEQYMAGIYIVQQCSSSATQ